MPARPLTKMQHVENRRFLAALADTGNAKLAAKEVGISVNTFKTRRSAHAAFAQEWEAALAAAHARFHLGGGPRPPADLSAPRTRGGEPIVRRARGGKLQLRLALPGQMTRAAEQAFFRALSATANVRLSAAAAGVSKTIIYRRRNRDEAFRREMRAALDIGYNRLELAMIEAVSMQMPNDDWQANDPPPIPPMTAAEALQLVALHRNAIKLGWDRPHARKRRNESNAQYSERLFLMWRAEQRNLDRERAVERGKAYEETGSWRLEGDWPEVAPLPDLAQVTGWSTKKATPDDPLSQQARKRGGLFGGWTIEDMEKRMREG